jgi:hypothetical protein
MPHTPACTKAQTKAQTSEPNAHVPPTGGNNQPPRQKIQACQPMGHPPNTTAGHPTCVSVEDGNICQPPNCSMEPGITYCTSYPEDSSFGALHDAFNYRLTGSCTANPEYDPGDMRKAILHALASSTDTTTPFLVVMVLPGWEGTPWYSAAIRSHHSMETLIQIPAGHMRFVPAHKQSDIGTDSFSRAKWPVELVLISNEEGRNQFVNTERIHQILGPALCNTCQTTTEQLRFFPNTRETRGQPTPLSGSPHETLTSLPGCHTPVHATQESSPAL